MPRGLGDAAERQLRIHLERFARRMASDIIAPEMPTGIGFAFIAFDYEKGGNIAYCSSGERADMIKALQFLVAKWSEDEAASG